MEQLHIHFKGQLRVFAPCCTVLIPFFCQTWFSVWVLGKYWFSAFEGRRKSLEKDCYSSLTFWLRSAGRLKQIPYINLDWWSKAQRLNFCLHESLSLTLLSAYCLVCRHLNKLSFQRVHYLKGREGRRSEKKQLEKQPAWS